MPVIPLVNPTKKMHSRASVRDPESAMIPKRRAAAWECMRKRLKDKPAIVHKNKCNPKRPVYVGVKGNQSFVFHSDTTPTQSSHGDKYTYAIGPFRTMLGAKIMARHGRGNPHLQCVADAERYAAKGVSWLLANGFHV